MFGINKKKFSKKERRYMEGLHDLLNKIQANPENREDGGKDEQDGEEYLPEPLGGMHLKSHSYTTFFFTKNSSFL